MNRRSGFTLIELLIVVLVIAILAAIGISKYQSFVTESRQKSCMSNLGALNNAYAVFETRNSSIPIDDACTQVIHPVSGEPMTTHANSQMYWRYQTPNFVAIDGTDGQTMQLLPQGAITQSANPARFSELGKIVQDTKLFCCPELAKRYGGATTDPGAGAGGNGHVLYQFFKAPPSGSQAGTDFNVWNPTTYAANSHLRIYNNASLDGSGDAHIKFRRGIICRAYGRYNANTLGAAAYNWTSAGITQTFLAGTGPDLSSSTLHANFTTN